jgi:hypothetical protein
MVDGQTMVDHRVWKPVDETCGPGSSPPIGIFILYFFNVSCQAEAQDHIDIKISTKYWELFL